MPLRFGWGCRTFEHHPMYMAYIYELFEHLLRLWMGIWLPTHTVIATDTSPDLWDLAEILSDASVQTIPVRFGWGCITFQTATHDHGIHMTCFNTFLGCGWAYGFTLTSLPPQTLLQICESWLKSYLMQVCKPCHYALIEAVEPFKLHPMSMLYIYELFKCLLRLWMGIFLPTHIDTTAYTFQDLQELVEILPDTSVQTMPLSFGWGCRTFKTATHVHVIKLWEVWAPAQVVDGHMASHSHRCLHRHFPRFVTVGWNPT